MLFQKLEPVALGAPASIHCRILPSPRKPSDKIIKIDFVGRITGDTIAKWATAEVPGILKQLSGLAFYVVADLRGASVLDENDIDPIEKRPSTIMAEGQRIFKQSGMIRSFVVTSVPTVLRQFRRIADRSEIGVGERGVFISVVNQQAHGQKLDEVLTKHAMNWLYDGVALPVPSEVK